MDDLFWLSRPQMKRITPYFPLSHGITRVDDRRVISGIIFVIRNGLRWRDAPREYGPHKTIYHRFVQVLWPEFQELKAALIAYLSEITEQVIREEVHGETGEAEEVDETPRIGR